MLGGPAAVERFSPDGEKAQESLARTKPRGPFTLRFFPHRMLKHQKKKSRCNKATARSVL